MGKKKPAQFASKAYCVRTRPLFKGGISQVSERVTYLASPAGNGIS